MKKKIKRLMLVSLSILVSVSLVGSNSASTARSNEDQLRNQLSEIEQQISQLNSDKNSINSQIEANQYLIAGYDAQASKLYGEIQIFQKEIATIELEIQELDIGIQVLDIEIEEKLREIRLSELHIGDLESESKVRIEDNYRSFRVNGGGTVNESNILNTDSVNAYFKDSQYISIIQEDTNKMLIDLATLKIELEQKKEDLAAKQNSLIEEKQKIDIKKANLDKQKLELDVKMVNYQAEIARVQGANNSLSQTIAVFSEEEAKLKAEYDSVMNTLFNSFTPTTNGEFVKAGKIIGQQGCTGLCTGPHLHFIVWENNSYQNPCGYISACGGNRIEMPIRNSYVITSWYGNRCFWWNGQNYCDFHNAIDLAASPWNAPVYAAHDGYAYKGVDPYGANYVIICQNSNCSTGIKTGYWHLSSF